MRILQITPTFVPSKFGGVKNVSYNLSKALERRGHEVMVYTTDADIGYSRLEGIQGIENIDGFKVRYFKNVSNLLAFKYRLFLPKGMISAIRGDITNFDIVHLHDYRNFLSVIVHHYAKKYGIPYVLQPHGSLPRTIEKQELKKLYDWILGKQILKDASKVIAVTKTEAEHCTKLGVPKDRIEIIPNGINLTEYKSLPEKGKFRRKYGIKNDEKVILFLGRIHKIKGLDFLVNAFADLTKEMNNVRLVIVGPDDGFLSTLKKKINDLNMDDKTLFSDSLYGKDKLEAYIDADALVYPSIYEIFGLVPFETIMCNTPVIVTDDCGCSELVKEVNCGYLVKYGDVHNLKEKMKYIIESPENGKEMVERGKKYIIENLSWDRVARKVEELYENCIHNT